MERFCVTTRTAIHELTIVLPTFNEVENVEPILDRISAALDGTAWEVVFVDDDSRDGTAAAVIRAAKRNPNVRIIRRVGRRGLSSAVVEGALSSMAPFIAVMDSDMQHDENLLPKMLQEPGNTILLLEVATQGAKTSLVGQRNAR